MNRPTSGQSRGGGDRPPQPPAGEISKWEWVAGAVGLLLVLGAVAYMARAATQPATAPRIVVVMDSVTTGGGGYLVHFTARNEGSTTAGSVTIEGELRNPAGTTVRSTATMDFVPAVSSRTGGLYFREDPRAGGLALRATGYVEP